MADPVSFGISLAIGVGLQLFSALITPPVQGPRLKSRKVPRADYGSEIPRIAGMMPLTTIIIWSPVEYREDEVTRGKIGGKTVEFKYYGDFAYAVLYGQMVGFNVLKFNGEKKIDFLSTDPEILKDSERVFNQFIQEYRGGSTQAPNPTMQAVDGSANTPAYRDLSYLFLKDFELTDYGNRPPALEGIICTAGSRTTHSYTLSQWRPTFWETLTPAQVTIANAPDDRLLGRLSFATVGAVSAGAHTSIPMQKSELSAVEYAVSGSGQYGLHKEVPMSGYSTLILSHCIEITSTSYRILKDGVQVFAPAVATPLPNGARIVIQNYSSGLSGIVGTIGSGIRYLLNGAEVYSGAVNSDDNQFFPVVKLSTGTVGSRQFFTETISAHRVVPTPVNLANELQGLCAQTEIIADVSGIDPAAQILGIEYDSGGSPKDWIQQLQQLYFFDVFQRGQTLVFRPPNKSSSIRTLKLSDLAADQANNSRPLEFEIKSPNPSELPGEVSLKFLDPLDSNYRERTVYSRAETNPSREKIDLTVSAGLTSMQAQAIADTYLNLQWLQKTVSFSLGIEHCDLEPGDIVTVPLYGADKTVMLTKVDIGANFVVRCESVTYEDFVWDNLITNPEFRPIPATKAKKFNDTYLSIISIGKIKNSDPTPVMHWGVDSLEKKWRTAYLYVSADSGDNWDLFAQTNQPSIFGSTSEVLPTATGLDITNSVLVTMVGGTLDTISTNAFNAGGLVNLLLVGNEILRFRDATLIGEMTYRLSYLKREQKGTSATGHLINEQVVLLSTMHAIDIEPDQVGTQVELRLVLDNQSLSEVTGILFIP